MTRTATTRPDQRHDAFMVAGIFGIAAACGVLWLGGVLASLISGHGVPHGGLSAALSTLAHARHPAVAWQQAMPGPIVYWTMTGLIALAVICPAILLVLRFGRGTSSDGWATRGDVRTGASARTLRNRIAILRPSLASATAGDLGYWLGSSRGVDVWMSVEDSLVILGPPRSGKGLHLVIPMIRDAPGAVITTSTRPDNITATLAARRGGARPVALFDPQGLAPTVKDAMRRSPIRGCDDPQTAMIRARALAAGSSENIENRGFWLAQTEAAIRAFLHAAALDGRSAEDLYRWSIDAAAAGEAVRILHGSRRAAAGWAEGLDAVVNGDPRTRDNAWAGVRVALGALADPRVLATVTPVAHEEFDPETFIRDRGTLYLLGTARGVGAAANLVSAFVEDVLDVARRLAAAAPTTRLDPPLALILDEAANYALPSLPSLISEGGGSGITTIAVLQSLAQARARWGEHEGAAIWDAASVKAILGGGANARDLDDLSKLIGERDEHSESISRDSRGGHSRSTNIRRVPILEPGNLRTLPFGTAVLLQRTAPPIRLKLRPWRTPTGQQR